jgi:hypothetical protein
VVGFDIERHQYGDKKYPANLVIQDVMSIDGVQFADAALIVAFPPCQAYSYRAMPWSRAKSLPPPDNSLFDACFRIQRQAEVAAGKHIPLIVENVRGAIPWVGRSKANFGSFHLWGDIPALIPIASKNNKTTNQCGDGIKVGGGWWLDEGSISKTTGSKSPKRKEHSAMIAKIPLALSRFIAYTFYPREVD